MVAALCVWSLLASVVAAALYAIDKRAAGHEGRRISERTLLGWSLAGGWPGAWIAGKWLRHKTRKRSYRVRFALCALTSVAAMAFGIWRTG